jgi:cyclase
MAEETNTHHHSNNDELGPALLQEVAPGVYSYVQPDGTWFINNTGFIVGDDAVISIDATSTERRTRAYLDAIGSVTANPVTMLVNTHHHADHTNGNYLFEDATIISTNDCRQVMLAAGIQEYREAFPGVEWGDLSFRAPDITFSGSTTLHLGDLAVELTEVGYTAHTGGDVIAWVPSQKVLFTGDLVFHGGTPFSLFGSIEGTLTALDLLESYGADVMVPGHGPAVRGPAIGTALDEQRSYLRFVQTTAKAGIDAGRTPLEQATATDLGGYGALTDTERLAGNLHVAYREAEPAGYEWPGFEVAIMDMVQFNGGKPPRCVA